jgi:hypothetical protein
MLLIIVSGFAWLLYIRSMSPEQRRKHNHKTFREALAEAVHEGNMDMLIWHSEHGLTIEECIFNKCQLLDDAIEMGAGKPVLEWFESMGLTMDHIQSTYDPSSPCPILSTACHVDNLAAVSWMYEKGFTVQGTVASVQAVFHLIIAGGEKKNRPHILACLYKMGVNANMLGNYIDRYDIIKAMVDTVNVNVMHWLINIGIVFDDTEITTLISAFAYGKIELFEQIYSLDPRFKTDLLRNRIVEACAGAIWYSSCGSPFSKFNTPKSLRWLLNRGYGPQYCKFVPKFNNNYIRDVVSLELIIQMGVPKSYFTEELWKPLSRRILVIIVADRRNKVRRERLPSEIWQLVLEFI